MSSLMGQLVIWCILLIVVLSKDIKGFTNSSGEHFIISQSTYNNFKNDVINCSSSSPNCYVSCDEENGCENIEIYAGNVENLYVECNAVTACSYAKIYASNVINTVSISCDWSEGCQRMHIYTENIQNLLVKCNGSSCYNMYLIGPQNKNIKSTANIMCDTVSCLGSFFNLSSTYSVHIRCNYQQIFYVQDGACRSNTFIADNSNNFIIECNYFNCLGNYFYLDNIIQGNMNFNGYAEGNYIYLNTANLTINCYTDLSCYSDEIYILDPDGNNNNYQINCFTPNACYNSYIGSPNINNNSNVFDINVLCMNESNIYSSLIYNSTIKKYQCGISSLITCCPYSPAILDCNILYGKGNDCFINCSIDTLNGTCQYYEIDSSDANSLTLDCTINNQYINHESGCYGSLIKLPTNNYTSSYINCTEFFSCEYAQIDISSTSYINSIYLDCLDVQSCYYLLISFNNISSINSLLINCPGNGGCQRMKFKNNNNNMFINNFQINCFLTEYGCQEIIFYDDIYVISPVNWLCSGSYSCQKSVIKLSGTDIMMNCKGDNSCYNTNIETTTSIAIYCNGDKSCDNSFISGSNGEVTVNCFGENSCQDTQIYGSTTDLLRIKCNNNEACFGTNIYCPYSSINNCLISCATIDNNPSCIDIDIHVDTDYIYGYLDLLSCEYPHCLSTSFYCDAHPIDTNYPSKNKAIYSYNNQCINESLSYCCPWTSSANSDILNCNDNEICIVDCSLENIHCNKSLINGTYASSLIVNCDGDPVCNGAYIFCPLYGDCLIKCIQSMSCNNLKIINHGNYKSNTFLYCSSESSCHYTYIYAENVENITIICNQSSCNYVYIDAPYAKNGYIECLGTESCSYLNINMTFVESLILNVTDTYGFVVSTLYALNASFVYLLFRSLQPANQYLSKYYLNSQMTQISCYGYGCYELGSLYITNSNYSFFNISMNGCGVCESPDLCINEWLIYCDYAHYNYYHSTYLHGSSCSNSECDCSKDVIEIKNNFINNYYDSLCVDITTTTQTPTKPPTFKPTKIPTTNKTNSTFPIWEIILIAIGGILILILIGWIIIKSILKHKAVFKSNEDQTKPMLSAQETVN